MRNARAGVCSALVLGLVATAALAQSKVQLNSIKKVQVKGGTVEITGTKKPNFTTFPMSDPPRFVIDISEAVFSGVPDEISVPSGGRVTAIKTASYGDDSSAIARVVIGFDRDLEPEVQASGSTL
ncbi:MAG TPA: AMIN domain-containing protein, partial [Actinomycetota bacterium]